MTALEYLKSRYQAAAIALIMKDEVAKRVLVAWTIVPVQFKDFELSATRPALDIWKWCEWDLEAIATIAAVPGPLVARKIAALRQMFLIYPDGTAAPQALAFINAEVSSRIRQLTAGKAKAGKE